MSQIATSESAAPGLAATSATPERRPINFEPAAHAAPSKAWSRARSRMALLVGMALLTLLTSLGMSDPAFARVGNGAFRSTGMECRSSARSTGTGRARVMGECG